MTPITKASLSKTKAPHVLVTRPRQQGEKLCSLLQKVGCHAEHVPVMEIVPLEKTPQAATLLQQCEFIIVVSLNAAQQLLSLYPNENYSDQLKWFAVGKTTATFLSQHGFHAEYPSQKMDSEGLLALDTLSIDNITNKKAVIIRGEGGRQLIAETLKQRGATVDSLSLYRRYAPLENRDVLRKALTRCDVLVVNSGESLDNLQTIANFDEEQSNNAINNKTLIVPGERVRQLAQAKGFRHILCADNATDAAVLKLIQDKILKRENL